MTTYRMMINGEHRLILTNMLANVVDYPYTKRVDRLLIVDVLAKLDVVDDKLELTADQLSMISAWSTKIITEFREVPLEDRVEIRLMMNNLDRQRAIIDAAEQPGGMFGKLAAVVRGWFTLGRG